MAPQLIPIQNEAQRLTFGIQVTFAVVSTLAVAMRLVARKRKCSEFQWDDYLIVIALVLSLGLITCDMIGTLYCGVGLPMLQVAKEYGQKRLVTFLKLLIPVQILWATSLAATKCSILLFYCRVFDVPRVQKAAKIIAVVVFLWCLTVILSSFLLCRPFAFNWDQTIPGGSCGNRVLSYVMTGVLNILTDIAVLTLPMPVIWSLQMRTASKIGLIAVFAVGLFVSIVSIVRLRSLLTLDYNDITLSVPAALIWSMLEPSVGITLACVPIFKNLIHRAFRSYPGSGPKSEQTSNSSNNDTPRKKGAIHGVQPLDECPLKGVGSASRDGYVYSVGNSATGGDRDSFDSGGNSDGVATQRWKRRDRLGFA